MAVAGSDEARESLRGRHTPVDQLAGELEKADDWGLLRFVPHERLEPGLGETWGWVPDIEPIDDSPDAWHPLDLLIAPLYDDAGALRGTLAMDLPVDGRRPGEAQRAVLDAYAEQARQAVIVALERQALADQVRMAEAARRIVRGATAQLSLDRIVADSRDALIEGFRAAGMWMQTFDSDGGDGSGTIYSADGSVVELTPELVEIAEIAARRAWDIQEVAIVAHNRPFGAGDHRRAGRGDPRVPRRDRHRVAAVHPARRRTGVPRQPGAHPRGPVRPTGPTPRRRWRSTSATTSAGRS